MKKDITLYNVLFPLWMLLKLSPVGWVLTIGGNFIIDSLLLIGLLWIFKIANKKEFFFQSIWKIYGFGLLSDLFGSILLLWCISSEMPGVHMGDEWFITVPALLISAVFIFLTNYFITFRNCDKKVRLSYSLCFAVLTAPYTFLVPSSLIYRF